MAVNIARKEFPMPTFAIETTYHLPVCRQRSYDAATVAKACRNAVADDDWSGDRHDYEAAGKAHVSGIGPTPTPPIVANRSMCPHSSARWSRARRITSTCCSPC
jgi:hypothetical protein